MSRERASVISHCTHDIIRAGICRCLIRPASKNHFVTLLLLIVLNWTNFNLNPWVQGREIDKFMLSCSCINLLVDHIRTYADITYVSRPYIIINDMLDYLSIDQLANLYSALGTSFHFHEGFMKRRSTMYHGIYVA